jgi:predicted nucleic acid-binding protein
MSRFPLIVVDTTTLFPDLLAKKASWERLLALSSRGAIGLCVPEVVVLEAARHFDRELRKAAKQLTEGLSNLRALDFEDTVSAPTEYAERVQSLAAKYEEYLRKRISDVGGEIRPLPQITHEELVRRDLAEAKPFKAGGKGYRDALIWATVVSVCAAADGGAQVVFVSNNSTDFLNRDGSLANDLASDVATGGGELPRVFDSLRAALETIPNHYLPALPDVPDSDDTISLNQLISWALLGASENLAGQDIGDENAGAPSAVESVSISGVEPQEGSISWQIYDSYEGGDLLVRAELRASVTLDGFVMKADIGFLPEDVKVLDGDWNDHMAWVGFAREMELSFHLRVNPDSESVDDVELESAVALSADSDPSAYGDYL